MTFQSIFAYGALGSLVVLMVFGLHPRWAEKIFGGTQSCIRWHHHISGVFMLFSIVHVLFALKPYVPDWQSFFELFPMFLTLDDPLLFFGFLALLFFFVLYPLSYAVGFSQRTWHFQHLMMYIAVFFALLHMLWSVGGRLNFDEPFLNLNSSDLVVLPAIAFVGLIIVFRLILERWPQMQGNYFSFKVTEKTNLTSNLIQLTLESKASVDPWQAGDYGEFQFLCHGHCRVSSKKHPFTVMRKISSKEIQLLIGAQGKDTLRLQDVEVGTEGRAFGPHSSFSRIQLDVPLLWIAGGAGIIPVIGLCYHWLEKKHDINYPPGIVTVVYLTDPNKDPYFLLELAELKKRMPWLDYSHHSVRISNLMEIKALLSEIPSWKERKICITGPHGMNYFWAKNLRKIGVKGLKIYTEDTLCAHI